jgi:hypothetical protein
MSSVTMTANDVISKLREYLDDVLGVKVSSHPWRKSKSLPYFLRDLYTFHTAGILDSQYLLMVADDHADETPATIARHVDQVKKIWPGDVIYVAGQIKSYERRRLIDHRISFIVPGNQMFLPLLGLDLREHFLSRRNAEERMSPSTQAFIIYVLINKTASRLPLKIMAGVLPYTSMTVSRIFNEMELLELGSCEYEGRERILNLQHEGKELWDRSLEFMQSPVKKLVRADFRGKACPGIPAGLTALAHCTMLAAPERPVFAVDSEQWNEYRKKQSVRELPFAERNSSDVEIWRYNPAMLSIEGFADPFSLYLSLRDDTDERVQASLNYMMENMKW